MGDIRRLIGLQKQVLKLPGGLDDLVRLLLPRGEGVVGERALGQHGGEHGVEVDEGQLRARLDDLEAHGAQDVLGLLAGYGTAVDAVANDDQGLADPLVLEVVDGVLGAAGHW